MWQEGENRNVRSSVKLQAGLLFWPPRCCWYIFEALGQAINETDIFLWNLRVNGSNKKSDVGGFVPKPSLLVFLSYCIPLLLYFVHVYTLSHPSTVLSFLSWPNSEWMNEPKLGGFLFCIDMDSSGSYFHLIWNILASFWFRFFVLAWILYYYTGYFISKLNGLWNNQNTLIMLKYFVL